MQNMPIRQIKFGISFYVCVVLFLFLLPIQIVLGWLISIVVHEMCHYVALRIFRIPIYNMVIKWNGVFIETGTMTFLQEFASAISGPMGGATLVLLGRWMPYTAICALIHTTYNLLPIFPLDGGRALRAAACYLLGGTKGLKLSVITGYVFIIGLIIACIYLFITTEIGPLSLLLALIILLRTQTENLLKCNVKNSTINENAVKRR